MTRDQAQHLDQFAYCYDVRADDEETAIQAADGRSSCLGF